MREKAHPTDVMEDPAIAIRMGLSRSPVLWILPVVRIVAYIGLIGIMVAFAVTQGGACVVTCFLLVIVPHFGRFLRHTFFVDRTTTRFFDERVDVDLRVPRGDRNGARSHSYRDVTHIELLNLSEIRMTLVEEEDGPYTVPIRVVRGHAEDLFDAILDQIQESEPDHLFSIYEHGHVRFSTRCELESLFPNRHHPVSQAIVNAPRITAGDHEFRIDWPVLLDDGRPILRMTTGHILTPGGMVLASTRSSAYREITIELFTGQTIRIAISLSVLLDGTEIGRVVAQPGEYSLDVEQPLPQIIAVMIVLTFIANRNALRI